MKKLLFILISTIVGLQTNLAQEKPSLVKHPYVEHIAILDHADRTYKVGECPVITISAYKGGIPLDNVTLYYSYGDEMMPPTVSDSLKFENGLAKITMSECEKPSFRECNFKFKVHNQEVWDVVKIGVEPNKIKSFTKMPKDFNSFWKQELRNVADVDPNPELHKMSKYSDDKVSVYLVRLTVGKDGRHFYGYLSMPNDGKRHPVMFCPPGAGPYKRWPQTEFAKKGFIVLNVDIHGLNPESSEDYQKDRSSEIWGYWQRGVNSRDSCYFKEVYAGCSRCIDYLCSLPQWDGKNVVTMDGSQGGALSIITAALNPKVTHVCAYYPALCDLSGFAHNRAGGWPKYFKNVMVQENDTEAVLNTLPYYDVVNFARTLQVPGYYSFGYNDDTCSPTSIFSMLNEIKAPTTIHNTYTNAHFNFGESVKLASDWVMHQVFGNAQ